MNIDALARAAAAAALLTACSGSLFTVTIEESSEVLVERGTPLEILLGDLGFEDFAQLSLSEDTRLANQGVEPGDISDVRFTSFVLTAVEPDGADLSFLESLAFYVEAEGLPRQLVASSQDFPVGRTVVELDLEAVDLTDYLVAPSMTITTDVEGGRPDQDTTVRADFALDVGATTQGACNAVKRDDQER